MTVYRSSKSHPPRRGQALVEMALVVTVLAGLSLGLVQFALIANARVTLTNLAREGARVAAFSKSTMSQSQAETAAIAAVKSAAAGTSLNAISNATNGNTTFNYPSGWTSGQPVTVTVTYDMRSKFFLPSTFPGLSRFGTSTAATATMILQN